MHIKSPISEKKNHESHQYTKRDEFNNHKLNGMLVLIKKMKRCVIKQHM